MSRLELTKACCSLLLPEEGGLTLLYTCLKAGSIRLSVGKEKEIFNREKYNDGKWHSVSFVALSLKLCSFKKLNMSLLLVGHVQFGKEEIPFGCGWHQSLGWSADEC